MSASVTIEQQSGYRFVNRFSGGMAPLETDLPAPLGGGTGPSPEHLLAAAVANCLSASLAFAFGKFKEDAAPITTTVTAIEGRNEANRMRIVKLEVKMALGQNADALPHAGRVLATFEDYCTVTASVRAAIPVELQVVDAGGARLK